MTTVTHPSLEPGQFKPKNEGINNTDVPGVPEEKKARNNPSHQDEGLSSAPGIDVSQIVDPADLSESDGLDSIQSIEN